MSSDNPPYPYYNGIPFNPSFFTSTTSTTDTGSGLTETAANALYLRKTIPDTATSLETFNGGITTPSLSSTGALSIGANNNSATNIANGDGSTLGDATGAVNIRTGNNNTGTISIGKYTSATNQTTTTISGAANISTTGGIVNIATGSARNTNISIGTGSNGGSQGSIDINTGAVSAGQTSINSGYNSTGAILIGNSDANTTQQCNIQSGQISIGTVAPSNNTRNIIIGATSGLHSSNTALNGITNIVGQANINTSGSSNTSIGVSGSTTAILGATNINTTGTSTTSIGNAGASNVVLGPTTINTSGGQNTSIGNGSSTTAIVGPTNINTTSGLNTTIGTANTGTTTIKGLAINIGDDSPVNINNATATSNLRNTNIGKTTGAFDTNTFMEGKTTVYKLSTDSITSTFPGNNVSIGANNTTNGGIKIGNPGLTTNEHNMYGTATITAINSASIQSATTATPMNIGTTLASATALNIGSATTPTTIGGTTTSTGLITANGGLTMGGSNNITLGNGTVQPTSLQLGFIGYGKNLNIGYTTVGMPTSPGGNNPILYGVATLPPGAYMFSIYFAPGTCTYARVAILCGTIKPADPSATGTGGTNEATFGSNVPGKSGNGVITLLSGTPAGGEFTSFGIGYSTTALPNIGISIAIAGTGTYIAGTYSFQFIKVG